MLAGVAAAPALLRHVGNRATGDKLVASLGSGANLPQNWEAASLPGDELALWGLAGRGRGMRSTGELAADLFAVGDRGAGAISGVG